MARKERIHVMRVDHTNNKYTILDLFKQEKNRDVAYNGYKLLGEVVLCQASLHSTRRFLRKGTP